VAQVGIEAAQREAQATEAEIRLCQSRRAALMQKIAEQGLLQVLEQMRADPELILAGDPSRISALERLMRTGLEQQRSALGLARVVDRQDHMGPETPMANLTRHREASALAQDLLDHLDQGPGPD
jgi:hypothetical protein